MGPGTILSDGRAQELAESCQGPISDLERAAAQANPIDEEAHIVLSDYLDSLRDLLIGMETYNDMVRYSQSQIFKNFVTTYHGSVWIWLSRIASTETVDDEKEGSGELKEDNHEFINSNKKYWKGKVDKLEDSLGDAGFEPTISDYRESLDPETKELMEPLESSFLR
jgi:hypothetical protein